MKIVVIILALLAGSQIAWAGGGGGGGGPGGPGSVFCDYHPMNEHCE